MKRKKEEDSSIEAALKEIGAKVLLRKDAEVLLQISMENEQEFGGIKKVGGKFQGKFFASESEGFRFLVFLPNDLKLNAMYIFNGQRDNEFYNLLFQWRGGKGSKSM